MTKIELKKASEPLSKTSNRLEKIRYCCEEFHLTLHPVQFQLLPLRTRRSSLRFPLISRLNHNVMISTTGSKNR